MFDYASVRIPVICSKNNYSSALRHIPIMSVEEELMYFKRLQEGDLEAAKAIIISHLRFVAHIARGYLGYGLPESDLIQEGNIGLMKAVKKFNPEYGVRLITFAVHWIKAEINEYIIKNWRVVKIATTKVQRKLFFNLRKSKKYDSYLGKKEINDLALKLGVKPSDVSDMEGRFNCYDASFDAVLTDNNSSNSSEATTLHAVLPSKNSDLSLAVEKQDFDNKRTASLIKNLSKLDDRSQDIIRSRWLADEKITLTDLANKYKLSAERIRQLEKQAFVKLKSTIDF